MAVEALVLSPHFDDAVLSCGHWLERHPGAVVATVFGGTPGPATPAGWWAELCGWESAASEAEGRAAEDVAALEILGAVQRRLPFLDLQYSEGTTSVIDVTLAIVAVLDELQPALVLFPLGLGHSDHILTRQATMRAFGLAADVRSMAYTDLPYAITTPHDVEAALQEMALMVDDLERKPFLDVANPSRKMDAVECYRSQVGVLASREGSATMSDILLPGAETYWSIG